MKVVPVSVQNTIQNTVQNNINPDSNSDSNSTPPSDFGNILKYVKGKFYAINIINILNKNIYICNEGPCPLIFLEKGFKNRSYKAKNLKNSYNLINNNISTTIEIIDKNNNVITMQ